MISFPTECNGISNYYFIVFKYNGLWPLIWEEQGRAAAHKRKCLTVAIMYDTCDYAQHFSVEHKVTCFSSILRVGAFRGVWQAHPTTKNIWQCPFMIQGIMLNIF